MGRTGSLLINAVPATIVRSPLHPLLSKTRHYRPKLLNFAAHSPEDANATENAVLRGPNGPFRRNRFST